MTAAKPDLRVSDAEFAEWERERAQRAAQDRAAHARALKLSEPNWVAQRVRVIDAASKHGAVEYIDRDTIVARCPICAQPLVVRFAPAAVDLDCTRGCTEHEAAAALFGAVAR